MSDFRILDNSGLGSMGVINGIVKKITPNMNSLKGVVTPMHQKMRNMKQNGFTLESIATNKDISDLFVTNEFPKMEKTTDGIFFQPLTRVISTIQQYYIKWFNLTKDMQISHDHNYQYSRVIPDGYLMKVIVPRTSDKINDYNVKYLVPVDNIPVSEIQSTQNTITVHGEIPDGTPSIKYAVVPFSPQGLDQTLLNLLMNRDEFISKYLTDILEYN